MKFLIFVILGATLMVDLSSPATNKRSSEICVDGLRVEVSFNPDDVNLELEAVPKTAEIVCSILSPYEDPSNITTTSDRPGAGNENLDAERGDGNTTTTANVSTSSIEPTTTTTEPTTTTTELTTVSKEATTTKTGSTTVNTETNTTYTGSTTVNAEPDTTYTGPTTDNTGTTETGSALSSTEITTTTVEAPEERK